jgi:hypothetical protein
LPNKRGKYGAGVAKEMLSIEMEPWGGVSRALHRFFARMGVSLRLDIARNSGGHK